MRGDERALEARRPIEGERLVLVEGIVAREVREREHGIDILLKHPVITALRHGGRSIALERRIVVQIRGEAAAAMPSASQARPLPGQPVRAWGRVWPIAPQTKPTAFDSRRYWRSLGVVGRMSVSNASDLEIGEREAGLQTALFMRIGGVREAMAGQLAEHLDPEQLDLARALLLGEAGRMGVPNASDSRWSDWPTC